MISFYIRSTFHRIYELLSLQDRKRLFFLLVMSVIFAGIEAISVSMILPFVSVATNPSKVFEINYYSEIYRFLGFSTANNFILVTGLILVAIYLFRGCFSVFYTYTLNVFTWGCYRDLSTRLFSNYLHLPYKDFTQLNSSQLEKNIISESTYLSQLITSFLRLLSESIVIVLLYVMLLFVNLRLTLVTSVIVLILFGGMAYFISLVSKVQGGLREKYQSNFYRLLNDSFGNFKFARQMGAEQKMILEVSNAASGYCRSNVINTTISQIPPTLLETFGLIFLVSAMLFFTASPANDQNSISLIAIYGLALYRMLPAVHRMLYYYNNVIFYRRSLEIISAELLLQRKVDGYESLFFGRNIVLKNINFFYPHQANILTNINLSIKKNERIAIIGNSGCGKTTLLDLIIGIHFPNSGRIFVDDIELTTRNVGFWRSKIGYIPQNIYLVDGTVADNVIFGKRYDEMRIIKVLKQACIWDFLKKQEGLDTMVGEGGVKLSGGQKQRIGIARALYGDPEILVLDEATSALDIDTETEIMNEVYNQINGKTLIVVTHKLDRNISFDHIYKLHDGLIEEINTN